MHVWECVAGGGGVLQGRGPWRTGQHSVLPRCKLQGRQEQEAAIGQEAAQAALVCMLGFSRTRRSLTDSICLHFIGRAAPFLHTLLDAPPAPKLTPSSACLHECDLTLLKGMLPSQLVACD